MRSRDFLKKIVLDKKAEVAKAKKLLPTGRIRKLVEGLPAGPRYRLSDDLCRGFGVICEIKRGSPSRGVIRAAVDPVRLAKTYEKAGACAISVLTDEKHFLGSCEDLLRVREAVRTPLLRKDFLIDEYQVYESRLWGADIVLLIAAILSDERLEILGRTAGKLGMDVIYEVHSKSELRRVAALKPAIIGVNNRDLRTFRTDIAASLELRREIPASCRCISESGIFTARDVKTLKDAGYDAVLVGEALMRSRDPASKIREFKRA